MKRNISRHATNDRIRDFFGLECPCCKKAGRTSANHIPEIIVPNDDGTTRKMPLSRFADMIRLFIDNRKSEHPFYTDELACLWQRKHNSIFPQEDASVVLSQLMAHDLAHTNKNGSPYLCKDFISDITSPV